MHRLATVLLLGAFLAAAATAAPAPLPRPWLGLDGWDKALGDGRLVLSGDKLSIRLCQSVDDRRVVRSSARLLRDVQGDFVVQVRVASDFWLDDDGGDVISAARRAGLFFTDGKNVIRFQRYASTRLNDQVLWTSVRGPGTWYMTPGWNNSGPALGRPAYLRVERKGNELLRSYRQDGNRRWHEMGGPLECKLGRRMKVGVVADAWGPGTFTPTFDQFKLTLLKK